MQHLNKSTNLTLDTRPNETHIQNNSSTHTHTHTSSSPFYIPSLSQFLPSNTVIHIMKFHPQFTRRQNSFLSKYDRERNITICLTCLAGVASNTLQTHLRRKHCISYHVYGSIFRAPETKNKPLTTAEIPHPPNGSPAVVDLNIHDGFKCRIHNSEVELDRMASEIRGEIYASKCTPF